MAALLPLALSGVQAGMQLWNARQQRKEAKKAMNFMTNSLNNVVNEDRLRANSTRYAGQDQDESNLRQGIADTFANVSRATSNSGDLLNAASKLQNAQAQGYQQIARQGQMFKQSAMDRYRDSLLRKSEMEAGNKRYSEALKGSAMRNTYNAVNTVLGGVAASYDGGNGRGLASNSNQGVNTKSLSGFSWDPSRFSSFRFNPNAFSAGF
jgi:hypothetical protein